MGSMRSRNHGLGLIEVVITVLILAVGLLGMAGLQTRAAQFNHSAYLRSQATVLAYDISDRMRVNRQASHDGAYNVSLGDSGSGSGLAGDDLTEWLDALATLLPDGQGSVACNSDGLCTVTVRWADVSATTGDDPGFSQYSYTTRI